MKRLPGRLVVLAALGLVGCAQPLATAPNPLSIDAQEYDRVYRAGALVLREYGFVLDRTDYRFGCITARPRASPTAIELFQPGNSSPADVLESTLNDQRRLVTVLLEPDPAPATAPATQASGAPGGPAYLLRVEVLVERREYPGTRLEGAMDAGRLVRREPTPRELQDRGIRGPYWRPLGRDEALEQRLVADIVRRSVRLPPDEPSPAP